MPLAAELKAPVAAATVGRVPAASVAFRMPMTGIILAVETMDGLASASSAVTSTVRERLAWTARVDQAAWP
jgi:hypothetical protein